MMRIASFPGGEKRPKGELCIQKQNKNRLKSLLAEIRRKRSRNKLQVPYFRILTILKLGFYSLLIRV